MPAKSKSQQRLMGMVHALQQGKLDPDRVSGKVHDLADRMHPGDARDFAETKHKGLPKKASWCLAMAYAGLKQAGIDSTASSVQKALHQVHMTRNKTVQDHAKKLYQENNKLRQQVTQAQSEASQASQATQSAQAQAEQATQLAANPPGPVSPPAAQPPFGAMALAQQQQMQANAKAPAKPPKAPGM